MNRTANDECLLCKTERSEKKNSHIIPKFVIKTFFGKDGKHKLYVWETNKKNRKPEEIQDGPKEDYILCKNCEKYFEELETHVSEYLHKRLLQKKYNDNFNFNIINGIEYAECLKLNNTKAKLLFLSVLWRCSISNARLFNGFQIQEEENLRKKILFHKTINAETQISSNRNDSLNDYYLMVIRSKNFQEQRKNLIYTQYNEDKIYGLIMNEYIVFFSVCEHKMMKTFEQFTNKESEKFNIILAQDELWNELKNVVINDIIQTINKQKVE